MAIALTRCMHFRRLVYDISTKCAAIHLVYDCWSVTKVIYIIDKVRSECNTGDKDTRLCHKCPYNLYRMARAHITTLSFIVTHTGHWASSTSRRFWTLRQQDQSPQVQYDRTLFGLSEHKPELQKAEVKFSSTWQLLRVLYGVYSMENIKHIER